MIGLSLHDTYCYRKVEYIRRFHFIFTNLLALSLIGYGPKYIPHKIEHPSLKQDILSTFPPQTVFIQVKDERSAVDFPTIVQEALTVFGEMFETEAAVAILANI